MISPYIDSKHRSDNRQKYEISYDKLCPLLPYGRNLFSRWCQAVQYPHDPPLHFGLYIGLHNGEQRTIGDGIHQTGKSHSPDHHPKCPDGIHQPKLECAQPEVFGHQQPHEGTGRRQQEICRQGHADNCQAAVLWAPSPRDGGVLQGEFDAKLPTLLRYTLSGGKSQDSQRTFHAGKDFCL
jgi:hypothetical protein